jgi:hypothetical protein
MLCFHVSVEAIVSNTAKLPPLDGGGSLSEANRLPD